MLAEAPTLASYRECPDLGLVEENVATPELDWPLEGLSNWIWPAFAKGSLAEKLSSQLVRTVSRRGPPGRKEVEAKTQVRRRQGVIAQRDGLDARVHRVFETR